MDALEGLSPALAAPATRPAEQLVIEAKRKTVAGGTTTYEGDVRVTFGRLALACDRLTVMGSSLRVLVYAPVSEPRLLLTFEGRTVMDYLLVSPKGDGPYHVIDIPIKDRHVPNFYLQARVIASKEWYAIQRKQIEQQLQQARELSEDGDDPVWCRIDVLSDVKPGEQSLKVEVTPQQQDHRPGENVDVAIRVTDLAGKPAAAEVYLRAETPGTSHILPALAYPMYDEKKRGESAAQVLTVTP